MYEAEYSLRDIAAALGVNAQTARKRLVQAGVVLRGKKMTERRKEKLRSHRDYTSIPLAELAAAGWTAQEIADAYGKQEGAVHQAMVARGIPRQAAKPRPERNAWWRGGYTVNGDGYVYVRAPEHPRCTRSGYVAQHRLVMEEHLGRYLTRDEVVDHLNGDPSDNRLCNLRLFASNAEHLRETLTNQPKLTPAERELRRQEAVRRGRERVAAILAESRTDADR